MSDREALGRLVREVWVECARELPDPKPSHLLPWDDLDEWNREVDRRIGEQAAVAERERLADLADELNATYVVPCRLGADCRHLSHVRGFGDLIREQS